MPNKLTTEAGNIFNWAKENLIQAFAGLSIIGGLASALVFGYGMYQDVRYIPKLKEENKTLRKEVDLNTKTILITHSVLKEELETIKYNGIEIYSSNSKDNWYFFIENGRSYVFAANHKKKDDKFYYYDFDHHCHEIGEDHHKNKHK